MMILRILFSIFFRSSSTQLRTKRVKCSILLRARNLKRQLWGARVVMVDVVEAWNLQNHRTQTQ